jgi:hypothetical protein
MAHFHPRSAKQTANRTPTLGVVQGGRKPDRRHNTGVGDDSSSPPLYPGLYSWDLTEDRLRGDPSVAQLFDLDPDDVGKGLPLMRFVGRIHADDRRRVADAIKASLISSVPYSEEYRIVRHDGSTVRVSAFGYLFRDQVGEPTTWVGLMHELPAACEQGSTLWYCLSAFAAAEMARDSHIAQRILDIVMELKRKSSCSINVVTDFKAL